MKKKLFLIFCLSLCSLCFAQNGDEGKTEVFKDKWLGIEYQSLPSVTFDKAGMGISLSESSGTFKVWAVSENGLKKSLFSTSDGGKTSSFYLKVDKTAYKLNQSSAVSRQLRKTKDGAQLVYKVRKDAQVALNFSFGKTGATEIDDVIFLDAYVTNISEKEHYYDLKAIFDTMIGENTDIPFRTQINRVIDSEYLFSDSEIDAEKGLMFSDGRTSVEIPFFGKNLTRYETVLVGSLSSLEKKEWIPESVKFRGFNDFNSSMNTAVMLDWDGFYLSAGKTKKISMCFVFGQDGLIPCGKFFTDDYVPEKKSSAKINEKIEKKEPEKVDIPSDNIILKEKSEKAEEKRTVDFKVVQIYDYQLDPEYIQKLVNRINSMQSDSNNVNHDEIVRLNAELDAIFEKLGRR